MSYGNTINGAAKPKVSIWPVVFAPLAAGVYYLVIKFAFVKSVVPVAGRTDFFETPHWGSHWCFRLIAEAISLGFGTFVAAALARGREYVAALVGGWAISLGFAAKLALAYVDPTILPREEPWYQYAIDAVSIPMAPVIGAYVSESATDMHRDAKGVGGINRLHFLWLWFAAYYYALGLITPIGRFYAVSDAGSIASLMALVINGIPALALIIPCYYGLAFLAGHHGESMHPAGRNTIGVLVLGSGFVVGVAIQFGWYWIFDRIHAAIFG